MATAKAWTNAAFRARALVELGTLGEAPVWLEAIERFGAHEPKAGKAPKQIHFDEDRLYQAYIHKHPEFRQQPVDLNSENPSAIKLFVLTQAALIEQGHSRKAAYDIVESEFQKAVTGSDEQSAVQTALIAAQDEEEAVLQEALKLRREAFGPPANLEPAPVGQQSFSFRQTPPQPPAAASSNAEQQEGSKFNQEGPQIETLAAGQTKQKPLTWHSLTKPSANEFKQVESADSSASEPRQQTAPAGFVQFGQKSANPADQ